MAELESGKVIAGKYRLLQPISEGGMGAIWRAQHTQLEAPVAINAPARCQSIAAHASNPGRGSPMRYTRWMR